MNVDELTWEKSSYSGPNGCVEVSTNGTNMFVRDGKSGRHGPILTFTEQEWRAFVLGVQDGEFDCL